MKRVLFFSAILFASCSSKSKNHISGKPDTTKVNAIYLLGDQWKRDTSFRIIKDTFRLSKIDTTEGKANMEWQKDTLYFIPILVDSATKQVRWYGVPPKFVQEVNVLPIK